MVTVPLQMHLAWRRSFEKRKEQIRCEMSEKRRAWKGGVSGASKLDDASDNEIESSNKRDRGSNS